MASILLELVGRPPMVQVTRDDVSNATWDEIATVIADVLPTGDQPLQVRPGRLLRARRALMALLSRAKIDLRSGDTAATLLADARSDDAALRQAIGAPSGALAVPESGDLVDGRRFLRELRDFQRRDLGRLHFIQHGANFSVPGAGKTAVTYALHALERQRGRVNRMLVICPISAFDAWERESPQVLDPALSVARWRNTEIPGTDVVIINYQRLVGSQDVLCDWMADNRVHLVVDEAHRIKRGTTGEWGRILLQLAPLARRRDVLTGTPAPNLPRDVVALLDLLWPGGDASRRLPQDALGADPPMSAMSSVNNAIKPLFVRTKKVELRLPQVQFNPVLVAPGRLQAEIYSSLRSYYEGIYAADTSEKDTLRQMGEVFMYLLQAASSPRLLSESARQPRAYRFPSLAIPSGSRLAELIDNYAEHEVAPKIAQACGIVRENAQADRKTLIWSNFPANLLDLERQLSGLQPALVYGDIPSREEAPNARNRDREIERFRMDPACKVLLANPAAMSEGVSLHDVCHEAVYVDRTFNAGQYLQSLDRIHRLGLSDTIRTRVTLLITQGSIDQRVDVRLADKTRRLAGLLDDPQLVRMALPDDDDYGEPVEEVDDLYEVLAELQRTPA